MEHARDLLKEALRFQERLLASPFQKELIEGASPVLWYGRPTDGQWLTIGTNPSRGEFFERDGKVRSDDAQKFYWRDQSFEAYLEDETALDATIEYATAYFEAGRATTSWFGKPDGAKLEALLEGMDRSFYDGTAIHVDFFKYATYRQMGQIRDGRRWMEHPDSLALLERTIRLIRPERLIVLGRDNCVAMTGFTEKRTVTGYPSAVYELGLHPAGIPMVGLHFKPSEVLVGLGNGVDLNGLHHGAYAKREHVMRIGAHVRQEADIFFS
ncbi:hypothetical protein [Exiguobacterium alkaliphilum]|uniref:hypothetical protein n=1 Tax=Exiguobacterium alkaliphilum TaxID=1428684 RepID=UPI003463E76E